MSFVPADFVYNVARGRVAGAEPFSAYGHRVATGAETGVLWSDGAFSIPPSAGVQMSAVSTSASDSSAGTGIRSIEIHYLDAGLVPQSEAVVLNGTTPVNTTATDIRFIQNVHMATYGSGRVAAGNISLSASAVTYGYIPAGANRCASSVKMVPAGKRLLITSIFAGSSSGSAAARAMVSIATMHFGGHDYSSDSIFIPLAATAFQDNSGGLTLACPLALTEGQVVGLTYSTDKATTLVGSWFGWVENA